ncbi:hypothetical protein NDU88_006798 [Pleurodeles waltl]|uniref:Uncharacterized protein n=1 Tax=Pleurodeles waltl TaxID=8319 RepID=A0AAV7TY75_PLEWA|nr:hypothetical protein NDU88_006798 [Pleurodeles waltl]
MTTDSSVTEAARQLDCLYFRVYRSLLLCQLHRVGSQNLRLSHVLVSIAMLFSVPGAEDQGVDAISSRITKWVVSLQDYDFNIKYIPGAQNKVADTLSRLVQAGEENQSEEEDEVDLDAEVICEFEENGFDGSVVTKE